MAPRCMPADGRCDSDAAIVSAVAIRPRSHGLDDDLAVNVDAWAEDWLEPLDRWQQVPGAYG